MADPYATLGVKRDAGEAEIKKAYRKLAKELHPDRNKTNPKASERFSTVTRAYDILTDKAKRAQYDRGEIDGEGNPRAPFGYGGGPRAGPQGGFGQGGFGGGGFPRGGPAAGFPGAEEVDLSDIFDGLFGGAAGGPRGRGGARRAPQKGADIGYRLSVPFEDAATLKPQRVTLSGGKTLDIKIPPGVQEGAKIRLAGQGQAGPGGTGDAIVTIHVAAHRYFRRDGAHIRLDLPVSLDEAVLGAKVKVPTVDGTVMLSVPKGSSSGKVLRLGGRGFTAKGGKRGDQLVTLMVDLPAEDEALARFAEGWSWRGKGNPRGGLGV